MARAMVNALTTFLPFLCLTFISVTTHYRNLSTEARACPRVNNTLGFESLALPETRKTRFTYSTV